MTISTGALRPKSEAPRETWQGLRGTTNYVNSNANEDNATTRPAQYPVLVPRIIATHWLRPEPVEARHG